MTLIHTEQRFHRLESQVRKSREEAEAARRAQEAVVQERQAFGKHR